MLAGKVAIVTGAAKGMGEVHAREFAKQHAAVVLTDVDTDNGARVASQISSSGGKAIFVAHDVVDESSWTNVIREAERAFGCVNVLVNNAGILIRKTIESLSLVDFKRLYDVNVGGTFLGCKLIVPSMRRAGGGSIINVSSVSGIVANMPGMSGYCATKGAIRMLTKAVAVDLWQYRIRVNSIHPGTIRTPLNEDYFSDPDQTRLILGSTVMARPGECAEVAAALTFLASDGSSYMTGSELVVDGGMIAV
ncbi:SDR family NAD(P)-dependent oxidoreductase [Bradyrhizobium sp. PRIMUS42]|uniref:SDR family NAD(P)-dependent oxidoreductase n=1 Tax=Bradyrhizobium sp. PRIMUS42 TaxID=2908926 RepID=UPI001FF1673F|nr:glucose 1-dehydrogenase [Bradyrhizobium sp. PRIMUS42]MCJ9730042.1 glucose 1-dehydrogenase [Bradyrhizobium sp. PRIMUS42]